MEEWVISYKLGRKLSCTFCGKSREEVGALIAGPAVAICNECILVALMILLDTKRQAALAKEETPVRKIDEGKSG